MKQTTTHQLLFLLGQLAKDRGVTRQPTGTISETGPSWRSRESPYRKAINLGEWNDIIQKKETTQQNKQKKYNIYNIYINMFSEKPQLFGGTNLSLCASPFFLASGWGAPAASAAWAAASPQLRDHLIHICHGSNRWKWWSAYILSKQLSLFHSSPMKNLEWNRKTWPSETGHLMIELAAALKTKSCHWSRLKKETVQFYTNSHCLFCLLQYSNIHIIV